MMGLRTFLKFEDELTFHIHVFFMFYLYECANLSLKNMYMNLKAVYTISQMSVNPYIHVLGIENIHKPTCKSFSSVCCIP